MQRCRGMENRAEERTVAGIARAVYNTLRELQVTDDASTLKTKLGYDKGVEVALYGKGAKEFAEAMEELLSRPINPRYIILYDVSGPVYGIPIISQVFNAVAEFAGITKQYFAVPSYFSANKERMERFARQWSIHVGGGRFVYTRSEEGSKMLSELVYSSISGWVADVSSRVYWNYFGGEEERRGRFA